MQVIHVHLAGIAPVIIALKACVPSSRECFRGIEDLYSKFQSLIQDLLANERMQCFNFGDIHRIAQ